MGQQYKSYTNQMSVDLYGLKVPQAILNGGSGRWLLVECLFLQNGQSGTGQADYQITAVYSDAENRTISEKSDVYLFGFQQKSAKSIGDTVKSGESR